MRELGREGFGYAIFHYQSIMNRSYNDGMTELGALMNEFERDESQETKIFVGSAHNDAVSRERIINSLRFIPQFVDAVKKLSPSDTFRVIMSADNAQFFKEAADGFFKPYLHDGARFVENVDLQRLPPDHFGAISNLVLAVNMAAIATDLNAIKIEVRDIAKLLSDVNRGEVHGAISAIRQSKVLTDVAEQRRGTLDACNKLSVPVGKLVMQLKSHCDAMPEPGTRFIDGFLNTGLAEATVKWREVEQDLYLVQEAIAILLQTYIELHEPKPKFSFAERANH